MPSWLTAILVEKVFKVILDLIKDAITSHNAKKKAKAKIKEIMSEEDRIVRAKRLNDFLQ